MRNLIRKRYDLQRNSPIPPVLPPVRVHNIVADEQVGSNNVLDDEPGNSRKV